MNNEHQAAQSDIKNPRELKTPGTNASHDPSASSGNSTSPKKIFVCSPYRPLSKPEESRKAELESNIHRAKTACRILTTLGFMPLAPYLYFTTFLKDEEKREREDGIRLGLQWLEEADEICFYSGGMGEFDAMSARAVRMLKQHHPEKQSVNEDKLLKTLYDEIIIPMELTECHYKSAITKRKRWITDRCSHLICFI